MIFSFFKKKQVPLEKMPAPKVDLHSHFIPGIDDGSKDMEESIQLLKAMQALGYEKVITTPHVMIDAYGNTKASIQKGLKELRNEAKARGLKIKIDAAAEYYLDEGLLPLIEKNELLLIDGKYLLFETSYSHRPHELEKVIFEIQVAGYIPLLAHPERYRYIEDPLKEYEELKALGAMFQVNLNSLGGYYGRDAKEKAELLSRKGMVDFLGSDVHHIKQTQFLDSMFTSENYKKVCENNTILNHTLR